MNDGVRKRYWIISASGHLGVLLLLLMTWDWQAPKVVFENTAQKDVISAVILGDISTSSILPKPENVTLPTPPSPIIKKALPKEEIALKEEQKKKVAEQKMLESIKKQREFEVKELLKDIQKQTQDKNELKQKRLKEQFAKTLKLQSEQSLRDHLFKEEIKLAAEKNRQSQGIINKYQALIEQAISSHWLVPLGANKKLFCILQIKLKIGGFVQDVQVIKGSGDQALDRSAKAAVFNASPLPVPNEKQEFAHFQLFNLTVRPEKLT